MSDGGKGSAPRKQQDHNAYSSGWDSIFGKKPTFVEKEDKPMWTLDNVVGRLLQLEESYFELLEQFEQLKAKYEADCAGHRNKPNPRQDMGSGDQGLIDW